MPSTSADEVEIAIQEAQKRYEAIVIERDRMKASLEFVRRHFLALDRACPGCMHAVNVGLGIPSCPEQPKDPNARLS